MTIYVTQQDINKGRQAMITACPIALALQRSTGKCWKVGTTYLVKPNGEEEVSLPSEACLFIRAYDDIGKHAVQPFHFDLPGEPLQALVPIPDQEPELVCV